MFFNLYLSNLKCLLHMYFGMIVVLLFQCQMENWIRKHWYNHLINVKPKLKKIIKFYINLDICFFAWNNKYMVKEYRQIYKVFLTHLDLSYKTSVLTIICVFDYFHALFYRNLLPFKGYNIIANVFTSLNQMINEFW